jgi:hypothetical protein
MPVLKSFKPSRQLDLLRSGLYECHYETYIDTPIWKGGDLYPVDDLNWDKYYECIKNNIDFEWESID